MKQVSEVGLWRWLGFAGDLGTWGNFTHRLDGDKGDGTVALSIVAGVARPRAWCFFEVMRARSNGGSGEAPACCVIVVVTARQPSRGPVLVVSLRQVEGGVPVAQRRRVPHSGGLPYAIPSASFNSLSTQGHA